MKTILVTGGAGFIGSHVCDNLIERGDKIICLDNFNDYYDPKIKRRNIEHNLNNSNFFLEEIDFTDNEKLIDIFNRYKFDSIIHLGARAGVRPSLIQPKLYFDVNINGTINLLENARIKGIKTFIFGSSSSVYGENKKIPFSEIDETKNQISPYASTKKIGELICKNYSYLYDINITCLRFFTVYGPRGRPDMAPYKFTKLIFNNESIEMYGDGSTKRDYTYINDIVFGIISALDKNLKFEIINLGNSNPVLLSDFIATIEKSLNKKANIIKKPIPKGDVLLTYADIHKAKKLLNYEPKTTIKEGISKFVEWYKKNN
jgi:UDP-glucuronate 4-epimerase